MQPDRKEIVNGHAVEKAKARLQAPRETLKHKDFHGLGFSVMGLPVYVECTDKDWTYLEPIAKDIMRRMPEDSMWHISPLRQEQPLKGGE